MILMPPFSLQSGWYSDSVGPPHEGGALEKSREVRVINRSTCTIAVSHWGEPEQALALT